MEIKEVKERLVNMKQHSKHDNERAHGIEDALLEDFVEAIKDNKYKTKEEIIKVATEVYKAREISFERWYA